MTIFPTVGPYVKSENFLVAKRLHRICYKKTPQQNHGFRLCLGWRVAPGTPNKHLKMDVWWFPTISYVKIGNHPSETTILNGWTWCSRHELKNFQNQLQVHPHEPGRQGGGQGQGSVVPILNVFMATLRLVPGTKAVKLLVGPTFVKSHDQLKGAKGIWRSPSRCAKFFRDVIPKWSMAGRRLFFLSYIHGWSTYPPNVPPSEIRV